MTNPERINLKAALESKRLELAAQFSGRISELTIDWIQGMSDREEIAGMLGRFSSTLAEVEHSLRAIDENCYGNCIRCHRPIALKRLQSIPWAAYCAESCRQMTSAPAEQSQRLPVSV